MTPRSGHGSTPNIQPQPNSRRPRVGEFLKLMGASFALAGLAGCEKSPFVAAIPYVDQPEDQSLACRAITRQR